ncbi:hypothetical protein NPIL_634751 [Nephila pilipes]|uniref:Uncharacterized protein n=1 Tax=Nephila pilipes TaxID=299642 RepID=A0A8X6MPG4_NEPPI|nr:hypothetical protein NPIL_634751 [Nephila pilipes]
MGSGLKSKWTSFGCHLSTLTFNYCLWRWPYKLSVSGPRQSGLRNFRYGTGKFISTSTPTTLSPFSPNQFLSTNLFEPAFEKTRRNSLLPAETISNCKPQPLRYVLFPISKSNQENSGGNRKRQRIPTPLREDLRALTPLVVVSNESRPESNPLPVAGCPSLSANG